ncbi:ARID DNA-binding domain-containing protein [Tanacetum coccineum]
MKSFVGDFQKSVSFMSLDVQSTFIITKTIWENLMKKLPMVTFLVTHLYPKPSGSLTLEDKKLKKLSTSHLMKALRMSSSHNLQLMTLLLLNLKDIHLMNIFVTLNLFKGAIPSKTAADAKVAIQEMAELSQKWHNGTSSKTRSSGVGRGVKEKDLSVRNCKTVKDGVIPPVTVVGDTSTIMEGNYSDWEEGGIPYVSNYVRNTWGKYGLIRSMFSSSTRLFSFQFSSMDGLDAMFENGPWFIQNNPLILKKWHPDENLFKEDVSTVLVWVKLHGVHVTAFSEDGLSAIATKLGTPLILDSYISVMCMQSWGRSSYARVMVELQADVELKDNIVVAMPKITREGHYTCNVRVEYEWKPPRCSSCKIFGHIHEECTKNTGAGEKKTVKKPSLTSRGVPVGPKMGFKPQKEYRPIPKKPTASSSGTKKKGVEPTIEVSNSNPFDVLNSIDNDGEFGTNRGTTNLVNNKATSSGSSFMNIDNDGEFASNTPIGEKNDKIERQIGKGKLRLLDNDENPLVPTGIVESDSEVEVVFDETANLRISTSGKDGSDKGYGTNSLLEQ